MHTVTVIKRPSGTLATTIPIMKIRLVMTSLPQAKLTQNVMTPIVRAMIVKNLINLSISLAMGVLPA